MKNVTVDYYTHGLIIGKRGFEEYVTVPNILKANFYESLLTVCLNGEYVSWSDLDGNRLILNYEIKNKFNVFINGKYIGDMPFIKVSETSVAIPIDTMDIEQVYEIYDSTTEEPYLLYESEILF